MPSWGEPIDGSDKTQAWVSLYKARSSYAPCVTQTNAPTVSDCSAGGSILAPALTYCITAQGGRGAFERTGPVTDHNFTSVAQAKRTWPVAPTPFSASPRPRLHFKAVTHEGEGVHTWLMSPAVFRFCFRTAINFVLATKKMKINHRTGYTNCSWHKNTSIFPWPIICSWQLKSRTNDSTM